MFTNNLQFLRVYKTGNMLSLMCFFLVFAITDYVSAGRSCSTFNDKRKANYLKKNVTGCIQRIDFENVTVVEAFIHQQRVKSLWRDTVRNMKYLTTVSFMKTETDNISPITFRNVPSLKTIVISHGNLKEILKGA
ncbi:hypothetical protein NQ317_016506 [Molorchus minor]|uniref:Uncharacterized protein n=1 Tax=Molorchus minor TaxID=1323400 RepID=A0ABQ9JUC2_9CUCU|nr:hypothetical protein NQ317_016506 [Molorchus minor]